jgi:hypothetical protein
MEAGTGRAISGNEYEGLSEAQVKFLKYLANQLIGQDTAGFQVELMTICYKWDPNRQMFVRC